MMKLTFALLLAVSFPAFAQEMRVSSVSELHQLAQMEQGSFAEGDCILTLRPLKGGLSLTMESEGEKAELLVRDEDAIQLQSLVDSDGSFIRTFAVNGNNSFRILHADDSFISLELNAGGRTVKCETDF